MRNYTKDFALAKGPIWLNAASEGPIPKVAVKALMEVAAWKSSPHLLTIPKFNQVPLQLKKSIATLINAHYEDVILGNSATYGIHLLANGLIFKSGDEVILMNNDFPTDILPWLHLKNKGVKVLQLKGAGEVLTPQDIEKAITPRTKVACLPYVHTFSGLALDITAIGKICRRYGILFIVNMSQAVGAIPVDMAKLPVDAVVCAGYKWLLGPYGTGFCWMREEVRKQLEYPQAYWISLMDESSLNSTGEMALSPENSSRKYDVFGTANFFNYAPWRSSIEYLLSIGIDNIKAHNQALVDAAIEGIDAKYFRVLSPIIKDERTNVVVFSHPDSSKNLNVYEYLKSKGIYAAYWKGKLRLAPHIYNTSKDIAKFCKILDSYDH